MAKLMKPLFIGGMFNKEGKRIRANYFKTIGNFKLWVGDGKPDRDYGKNADDKYYVLVEINDYLVMTGYTWYQLAERAGYEYLLQQWYNKDGREKYYEENFYKGKTSTEYQPLISEHVKKENNFIKNSIENNLVESIIIEILESYIKKSVDNYIEARDNNGTFPDFVGALYLNELDKCIELSVIRHKRLKRENEERQKKIELEHKERKKLERQKALKELEETIDVFKNGGTITNIDTIVKLADKYRIEIPIRTRGWILNDLSEVTITDEGNMSYKYWKRSKNAKGSTKVYDILYNIQNSIKGVS